MSLIAHYPLINDLKDYSGNGYDLTTIGTPANVVAGKMGKCYQFTYSPASMAHNRTKRLRKMTKVSYAGWLYHTRVSGGGLNSIVGNYEYFSGSNAHGFNTNFGINQTSGRLLFYYNAHASFDLNHYIPNNTWTHVVLTIDYIKRHALLYVNNMLVGDYNIPKIDIRESYLNISHFSEQYNGHCFNGKLNDIRVYDHILSPEEVKEIAKAKVLHYAFNDPYEGYTKNMIQNTNLDTGWNKGYAQDIKWNDILPPVGVDSPVVSFIRNTTNTHSTGYWYSYGDYTDDQIIGETYTVSIYVRTEIPNHTMRVYNQPIDSGTVFLSGYASIPNDGRWHRISWTFVNTGASNSLSFRWDWMEGKRMWLCAPQMERGAVATPFVIGERRSMIMDSSGFGHHTHMNDPVTSGRIAPFSSTGSHSLKLEAGETTNRGVVLQTFPAYDEATLCAKIFYIGGTTYDLENILDNSMRVLIRQNGAVYTHTNMDGDDLVFYTTTQLVKNTWNHIAVRIKSNEAALFINGVKEKTLANNGRKITNSSRFSIGTEGGSDPNYRKFNGYVDNVELFATALSDEEMLNSYGVNSNKMKLDLNNNHIVVNEIIERENLFDTERIYTLGQLLAAQWGTGPKRTVKWGVPCIELTNDGCFHGSNIDPNSPVISNQLDLRGMYPIVSDFKPNTQYLFDIFVAHESFRESGTIRSTGGFFIQYTDGTCHRADIFYTNPDDSEGRWRRGRFISAKGKSIYKLVQENFGVGSVYVAPQSKVVEYDDPWISEKGELVCSEFIEHKPYIPSLVDYEIWKTLGKGSIGNWIMNGETNENERMIAGNPYGDLDYMWVSPENSVSSDSDGGFVSPISAIDKTKKYRFSCWMRKEKDNGSAYIGLYGHGNYVKTLAGAENSNPYFYSGAMTGLHDWYLFVGYVHPHTHTGTTVEGKIYKKDGSILANASYDYKWGDNTHSTQIRAYLYYSTDTTNKQYFYRPRIDLCDGNEPSIQDLLILQEHSNLLYADDDTIHIDEYGNIICNTFNEE